MSQRRDPTLEILTGLTPATARVAVEFVSGVRRAGFPLVLTSGRRGLAEQRRLVAAHRSRTLRSKHLSGEAFDVDVLGVARDAVPQWFWDALGPYGERFGLTWGGRWRAIYDPGHFEL